MERPPKIVVLDGYTLNPGDISWDELKTIGPCDIYDRTAPDELLDRAREAEIVLTNKTVLDRTSIAALPAMKYIGVMATGYNVVDNAAADERHIPITNVPEYGTSSVAQMVFALLLELTNHVGYHSGTVFGGRWSENPDFCYWDRPLRELEGNCIGIVGFGRIGRTVARIARAFGMRVQVYDIQPAVADETDVSFVDLDELFRTSDVVSLHCPLTPETEKMVNGNRLRLMKKTAFLINTGRGPLVNEDDLAEALITRKIAGAALDVLTVEPPHADNPLLSVKNCVITPHIAWATLAARRRLMDTVVGNVRAFLAGKPVNVVNSP